MNEDALNPTLANGKRLFPKKFPTGLILVEEGESVREAKPCLSLEAHRRLGFHPLTGEGQQNRYWNNRVRFMQMFDYIESVGESSREKSLALTALQESLMWLNAHVACNDIEE